MPAPHLASASPDDESGPIARRITRRKFLAGSAAIPLSLAIGDMLPAFASGTAPRWGPAGACGLPDYVLTRIWRGYDPAASGQIIVVPHGMNFLGAGVPHAGPWGYTQAVPMLWYGPGQVQPGFFPESVTSADIAPTIARILGFPSSDWTAPDGHDMQQLQLVPNRKPLKLIVVMVWDAGGRYVLGLWPPHWPHLRALGKQGAWFDQATVGSSPSNTAPIHASIGTGAFPRHHGIIDNVMKFPDGQIRSAWAQGPNMMKLPAFAEIYQQAMGDRVNIGMAGSVTWHLAMVGRGNNSGIGPQPVVLLKNDVDGGDSAPQWEMPPVVEGYYRFFDYATQLPPLDDPNAGYFDFARKIDGTDDGLWRGKDVASLEGGWASPARIPYQHRAIKSMITREGFGHHGATDLLFLNYKLIDEIGHRYFASSLEMSDCVRTQDLFLRYFVNFLDKQVGEGNWIMLVTADHGHTAAPAVSGGYLINQHDMEAKIEALRKSSSDPPLISKTRPMWLNIDDAERVHSSLTYQDISKLVASMTHQQTAAPDDPSRMSPSTDPVFDAAFAGSLLTHLPCWSPPSD